MISSDYYTTFDWRQAKFYLDHPAAALDWCDTIDPTSPSLFLASEGIDDVLIIRNWLYCVALRYRLLGCYNGRDFRGLVIEFDSVADLALFRQYWQTVDA